MILEDFKGKLLSLGHRFGRYLFHLLFSFQTYKDNFAVKLVREWNFINLIDLLVT